jgi:uncharacterized protein (DUF2252 family)
MSVLSAWELARRQLERDRARMSRAPWLLSHKIDRMLASPFAFLRGSAPLFYEVLRARPELSEGPDGAGFIAGDLHLENFGCYRTSHPTRAHSRVVFGLNDFDDAAIAPWRWDVVRLGTSLLLAARGMGFSGASSLELFRLLVDSYRGFVRVCRAPPPDPARIARLLAAAQARSHEDILRGRTRGHGEARRFVRGAHYRSVSVGVATRVRTAFARYARAVPDGLRPREDAFDVLDVAFRIAGTGSLGGLRFGILVRGKGGRDGAWMFDMKEEGSPACSILRRPPPMDGALRVLEALRTCLPSPPQLAGTTKLGPTSMLVRRLAPQEEKLDLSGASADELPSLVRCLAWHTAGAHRRGAKGSPPRWRDSDIRTLVRNVVTLAGIHEAAYLAYCELTGARGHH